MKNGENDKWLDKVLGQTIGEKKSRPDFEKWQQNHRQEVKMLTSRAGGSSVLSGGPLSKRARTMKSRIMKLAAAAVIIALAVVGVAVLSRPHREPGEVSVPTDNVTGGVAEGSGSPVEIEFKQVRQMYAAGDAKGLAGVLAEGEFESKVLAANLLAQMDNGTEALGALEKVEAEYGKDNPGNPFTAAVETIRKNNLSAARASSPAVGVSPGQRQPEPGPEEVAISPSVEAPAENGTSLTDARLSVPGGRGEKDGGAGGASAGDASGPQLTEGVSGKAYFFDGESDYINIVDSKSLDISGDQISISVWMKTKRLDKRQVVVAKNGWGDDSWLVEIYPYRAGEARLTFYTIAGEPSQYDLCSRTMLKADTWYHLVFVYTGKEKRVYMNAELDTLGRVSGKLKTNDQPVRVGGWGDPIGPSETRYFNGVIDEVALFDRALSEAEVARLYENRGRPGGRDVGLVGYWSFDNDRGTTVVDGSRYHNDGELRDEPESYFAEHGWAKKPGAEAEPEPEPFYDENGPTLGEGISGYAYYFDGRGDYINIEESESLDISGDQITISAWIKPDRIDRRQVIAAKNAGADDSWIMEINPIDCGEGRVNFFMLGEDTGEGNLCGNGSVALDRWCHVVCVYTGQERIIYLNGEVDANRAGQGKIHVNDQPVRIGNWGSLDRPFNGTIDEVAIFNRALSGNEVVRLYQNSGRLSGNEAGLVAYWNFDRHSDAVVLDSGPYQNDGELRDEPERRDGDSQGFSSSWGMSTSAKPVSNAGAAPELAEGVSGYAYYFDGGGSYINIEESESLDISGRQITLSAWINAAQINTRQVIVAKTAGGDNTWIMEINPIDFNDGTVCFYLDLPGFDYLGSSTAIVPDRWYHIVMVYNETERMIYIDGQRDAEQAVSGGIPVNDQPVRIGNWGSLDRPFNGTIDEVAIFNRALSDYEIGQLYRNTGRLRGNEAGLVGYWNFDRDDGDVVSDMGPNGNHGKLGGG